MLKKRSLLLVAAALFCAGSGLSATSVPKNTCPENLVICQNCHTFTCAPSFDYCQIACGAAVFQPEPEWLLAPAASEGTALPLDGAPAL